MKKYKDVIEDLLENTKFAHDIFEGGFKFNADVLLQQFANAAQWTIIPSLFEKKEPKTFIH